VGTFHGVLQLRTVDADYVLACIPCRPPGPYLVPSPPAPPRSGRVLLRPNDGAVSRILIPACVIRSVEFALRAPSQQAHPQAAAIDLVHVIRSNL